MEERSGLDEAARLRRVIDVQREVTAAGLDPEAMLTVIAQKARELTGGDASVIELVEGNDMVYRTCSGSSRATPGMRIPRHGSLSGLCVQLRRGLICADSEADERVDREACRRVGLRSMVVVPLLRSQQAVGVLKVHSAHPDQFHDYDVEILEFLSGFLADSIRNATDHDQVTQESLHDPLTGLPNRALLMDRLTRALERGRRGDLGTAVFFLDLDGFKELNDSLGHTMGDRLLKAVAEEWSSSLRAGDTLARFGGDEFVLVCENTDRHSSASIRLRLAAGLARAAGRLPRVVASGVSIGTAWTADPSRSADEMLAAADASMYRAKARQRGSG